VKLNCLNSGVHSPTLNPTFYLENPISDTNILCASEWRYTQLDCDLKKITKRLRDRTVKLAFRHRSQPKKRRKISRTVSSQNAQIWKEGNAWIQNAIFRGEIQADLIKKKRLVIHLPEVMDFSDNYERTVLYITAIRKLVNILTKSKKALRLSSVRFGKLRKISTSAALVLTAELSKWDDEINSRLVPDVESWDPDILQQFYDLGFFDLFQKSPDLSGMQSKSKLHLVKYIKGKCGDKNKTRLLKSSISEVVGESISKWTFLHSGLSEAITNVSHHAYPKQYSGADEKFWYLTGSYNSEKLELKIAFYDQGIGIPRSLPSSKIYEKVLRFLSVVPAAERRHHKTLLRAAVAIDRTSTGDSDRGKGLPDLLEFIKQRRQGYLSILSLKGLYKYTVDEGNAIVKSESFHNEMPGTLIIWCVKLSDYLEADYEDY